MANLTITIDEDVLRDARIEALYRKTSVNRMVADYLRQVAGSRMKQKEAAQAIRALMSKQGTEIDPTAYRRDELYSRG